MPPLVVSEHFRSSKSSTPVFVNYLKFSHSSIYMWSAVVLTCITFSLNFPDTNDAEHLFLCLFTILITLFREGQFTSLVPF